MELAHSRRLIPAGSLHTQAAGIGLAALAGVATAAALSWTLLLPDPAPAYRPLPPAPRVPASISTAQQVLPARIVVPPTPADQPRAVNTVEVSAFDAPPAAPPTTTRADARLELTAAL